MFNDLKDTFYTHIEFFHHFSINYQLFIKIIVHY